MALAWTLLGLCLALESWYQISAAKKGPSDGEAPRSAEPLRYFDLWRCICVACVVVTHIWEGYHAENILGCGQWVLQFLMLISGTCFAKSSSSLMRYCWRLLLVWSVGTLLNWMVMVAVEAKWRDSSWRVQFQMGFCLQILVMALATAPLKWHFTSTGGKQSQDAFSKFALVALVLYASGMLCALAVMHGFPKQLDASLPTARLGTEILESAGVLLLATIALCALAPESHGWIGWAMLVLIQLGRVAHSEPRPGSEIHLCDLYAWAVFIHFVPLTNQSGIGLAMAGSWPIWALACAFLLGLPGSGPEFPAMFPSNEVTLRARFYAVETIFAVAFITIPAAGPKRTLPIPAWMGPSLSFLNKMSLLAFTSHKAIITLVAGGWEGLRL